MEVKLEIVTKFNYGDKVWYVKSVAVKKRCHCCGKMDTTGWKWVVGGEFFIDEMSIHINCPDCGNSVSYCDGDDEVFPMVDENDCFPTKKLAIIECRKRNIKDVKDIT